MQKNNKRKSTLLLIALLLVGVLGIAGYTYSRYYASGSGSDTVRAANFNVKVNDVDIVANDEFTVELETDSSDYVVDGLIAPGVGGNFDVVIDPTGSEVALKYSINNLTITDDDGNSVTGVSLTGYSVNGGTKQAVSSSITGTIDVGTSAMTDADSVTITIYYEWTNDDSNNENDTSFAGSNLKVSGNIEVYQVVNGD